MGIEPTAQAWEAWVLPLYDARYAPDSNRVPGGRQIAAGYAARCLPEVAAPNRTLRSTRRLTPPYLPRAEC